jgi:hypothetical protein
MKLAALPLVSVLGLALAGCDGSLGYQVPEAVVPPSAHQLTTSAVSLVGDGDSACSQPAAGGDVWCSFVRDGALWAVNVSRAAREKTGCDQAGPACLRLSTTLWMGDPIFTPSYPGINEFSGETLFIYGDATTAKHDDPFAGVIKAWRPGWSEARAVSTSKGYLCRGHATAPVAYCLDNIAILTNNLEFDLLAGPLDPKATAPLPSLARVRALGQTGQVMWGASFSPGGEQMAFSLPAAPDDSETLRVVKTADTGHSAPTDLLRGAARWRLSADGKKIYYLDGFNYADRSAMPSGTLAMVDFPLGGGRTVLAPAVGDFQPVVDGSGTERGLALLSDMASGSGTLRLMLDRDHPSDLLTVGSGVSDYQLSPDLRYGFVYQAAGSKSRILRSDGSGGCDLNTWSGGLPYLVTFHPKLRAVFFAEDDSKTQVQGWYADPEGCQNKTNFVSSLAYLLAVGDGIIYSQQDVTGRHMNLQHLAVTADGLDPAGPTLLANGIDTRVAVGGGRFLLFTISDGADGTGKDAGLWAYGPLPK